MNVIALRDGRAWRQALRQEWAYWTPSGLFALKTLSAALLALWIAFRLDLASPSSAMVTVFIVAQPGSGLVLEKSLYRLLGTIAGSAVTLVLVALFAQQRELFLLSMALWIGGCTAGATWFRSFQSYAFVLAGYTATLVGFAAVLHPAQALEIAIDRISVVGLGILCAGVVADGLFPQRLSTQLVGLVRGRSTTLYREIGASLLSPPDDAAAATRQAALVASVASFETQRSAAAVEDPETRARSARLQRLNAQFMATTSTLHTLERWRQGLDNTIVERALRPTFESLATALVLDDGVPPRLALQAARLLPRLRHARAALPGLLMAQRGKVPETSRRDFDSAAALLRQLAGELVAYTDTYAALYRVRDAHPRPALPFHPSVDARAAVVNGFRAALVLLVTSAFWIITAWPDALPAIINATVFSALFATSPTPVTAIRGLLRGFALGFVAALSCALLILPALDGFPLLAAALSLFLLPGVLWLAQPARAGMGIGYLLMFTVAVSPANIQLYDTAHLINSALATLLGAGTALLAFTVLVPDAGSRSRARWLTRLRTELAETCDAPLRGRRHRFESATRDLLQQTSGSGDNALDAALRALEAGHAVLALRRTVGAPSTPTPLRGATRHGLASLARWLRDPTRPRQRDEALDSLRNALDACEDEPSLVRTAAALHRLRSVLRAPDFPAVIGLTGADHAA